MNRDNSTWTAHVPCQIEHLELAPHSEARALDGRYVTELCQSLIEQREHCVKVGSTASADYCASVIATPDSGRSPSRDLSPEDSTLRGY